MPRLGRSTVSIAHSERSDLSDDDVLYLVRRAVELVGGIEKVVRAGDTVLLKPNQTVWRLATEGVTTDPRVVAALVTLSREAGAERVIVADSSGGDLRTRQVLETTGMARLARQAGADDVVGFEDGPHEPVRIRVGSGTRAVQIPRLLLDADTVINVPKAKTHFQDPISCAMKNWVGIMGQHQRPMFMDDDILFDVVARLHKKVPAALHVVDALWAGEGDGPAANEALWMGCVLAGRDPVAVDATVAQTMGISPHDLRFAGAGESVRLGTRDPAKILVRGSRIADVAVRARRNRPGFGNAPVRVLAGEGVTWAGSLGHVKSAVDVFQLYGIWDAVVKAYGRPTIMIGATEDPDFEHHVEKGPYFVVDDIAREPYKSDPRVEFVPGHPATQSIFPHLFRALHVERLGSVALEVAQVAKRLEAYFHFRSWKAAPEKTAE